MITQTQMIQEYLELFGSITPAEAAELGCMRLAARIADLKAQGVPIRREMESRQNRFGRTVAYARYYIVDHPEAGPG